MLHNFLEPLVNTAISLLI